MNSKERHLLKSFFQSLADLSAELVERLSEAEGAQPTVSPAPVKVEMAKPAPEPVKAAPAPEPAAPAAAPVAAVRPSAHSIRSELRRVSQTLPARSHVRRFAFVDELSPANGFVTCKAGFARSKIEAHFVHYLNTLYDETPQFFGYAVDDYDDLF